MTTKAQRAKKCHKNKMTLTNIEQIIQTVRNIGKKKNHNEKYANGETCKENIRRIQQLHEHKYQHGQKEQKHDLYNLDPKREIDRRKIIYKGIQSREKSLVYQLIKYAPETQIWICAKCEKRIKT